MNLKNCPFCGNEANKQYDYDGIGNKLKNVRVGCETICCRGNLAFAIYSDSSNAINLWNTRTAQALSVKLPEKKPRNYVCSDTYGNGYNEAIFACETALKEAGVVVLPTVDELEEISEKDFKSLTPRT